MRATCMFLLAPFALPALASCAEQRAAQSAPQHVAVVSSDAPPPPAVAPSIEASSTTVATKVEPEVAKAPPTPACSPLSPAALVALTIDESVVKANIPAIEGDSHALDPFYEKLARIARGSPHEKIRIAFYGDSNMTPDFISGALRRELQTRFGDAGHGFVAAARPWPWYEHRDVQHGITKSATWNVYATSTFRIKDEMYGLANIAAESGEHGATTWVATAETKEPNPTNDPNKVNAIGINASSAEIFYLKRPYDGIFSILVDGKEMREENAWTDRIDAGFSRVEFTDGAHKVEAVVKGNKRVRFYGTVLERDVAGVVVDSLGTGALNYEQIGKVESATRIAMLKERNYDLVLFLLGTNMFAPEWHAGWVHGALADFRTALPNAPIMLMSPPDHGITKKDWASDPRIEKLAAQMKEIAQAEHVLFWDFYGAMGGKGSIKNFVKNKIAEPDCIHLGPLGGTLMGARFASEVLREFHERVEKNPTAGCALASPAIVSSTSGAK